MTEITDEMVARGLAAMKREAATKVVPETTRSMRVILEAALNPTHHPSLVAAAKAAYYATGETSIAWEDRSAAPREASVAHMRAAIRALRADTDRIYVNDECFFAPMTARSWNAIIDRITGDADEP